MSQARANRAFKKVIIMDFTAITNAIDTTTIGAAITAIAALKIAPGVAKWGYNKVIGWFRG
tara:strand:+ start:128 stop:310 length:183 start_codon:yes stop_codon:yes gene_type:complete